MSLKDFLPNNACPICELPPKVRAEVEGARSGTGKGFYPAVVKWLAAEHGVTTERRKVQHHFDAHG